MEYNELFDIISNISDPELRTSYLKIFSDPKFRFTFEIASVLHATPDKWTDIDYHRIEQTTQNATQGLCLVGLLEAELQVEYRALGLPVNANISIHLQGNGDSRIIINDIKTEFCDEVERRGIFCGYHPGEFEATSFNIERVRLAPDGSVVNQALRVFIGDMIRGLESNDAALRGQGWDKIMYTTIPITNMLERKEFSDPHFTKNFQFHFEPPVAMPVKLKKTTTTKPPPLDGIIGTLPDFPTDEQENADWTTPDSTGIKSHRQRRDEGEKITLKDDSVLGRDKQGRIWWKPEEDSQKVFYLKSSLPQPVTKTAQKHRKK